MRRKRSKALKRALQEAKSLPADYSPAVPPRDKPVTPPQRRTLPGPTFTPHATKPIKANIPQKMEYHANVDFLLEGEIKGDVFTDLHGLDEVKLSDDVIGFNPNEAFSQLKSEDHSSGLYRLRTKRWSKWPKRYAKDSEQNLAECINEIADYVARSDDKLKPASPRVWSSRYANEPVPLDNCKRKPDLVLMNRDEANNKEAPGWNRIFAVLELKLSTEDPVMQLAQYARLIFGAQPDRQFVLGVAVTLSEVKLVVFNRSGMFVSDAFNVHMQPERCLRVIVGMMFLNRRNLGFDSTMHLTHVDGPKSNERFVMVKGKQYRVDNVLHVENVIKGRATVVLQVSYNGEPFVVKNAWVDCTRTKEPEILADLKDLPGVVKLLDSEEFPSTTVEDFEKLPPATEGFRALRGAQKERLRKRSQVRVVLSPFGTSLLEFKSLRELVQAIIHIVEAIEALYTHEKQYLHRDISLRNILLGGEANGDGERNGLLIDFDYAVSKILERVIALGHRTGTLPFMAVEVLKAVDGFQHDYYHDLESLFYVLCFICVLCSQDDDDILKHQDVSGLPIAKWYGAKDETLERIGERKYDSVKNSEIFKKTILDSIPSNSEFRALTGLLEELRTLLVPPSAQKEYISLLCLEANYTYKKLGEKFKPMEDREFPVFIKEVKDKLRDAYNGLPKALLKKRPVKKRKTRTKSGENLVIPGFDEGARELAERARELLAHKEPAAPKKEDYVASGGPNDTPSSSSTAAQPDTRSRRAKRKAADDAAGAEGRGNVQESDDTVRRRAVRRGPRHQQAPNNRLETVEEEDEEPLPASSNSNKRRRRK